MRRRGVEGENLAISLRESERKRERVQRYNSSE